LLKVLSAQIWRRLAELRAQVSAVVVTDGRPTILDFDVDPEPSVAPCADGPIPVRAFVDGSEGKPVGELVLVW
jgi:hypothetical protein